MRVGKLGHASTMVTVERTTCLADPVLTESFECSAVALQPPISINVEEINTQLGLILLSHRHMDHFCVKSLSMLRRDVPVLYPAGDALIASCLRILGFANRLPVTSGQCVSIGELKIFPTESKADFPEYGALFVAPGATFWNMIDSVVNDKIVSDVRQITRDLNLLFAKYQPLVEEPLCLDALGSCFPIEKYGKLLRHAALCDADVVVPASCGYRYIADCWLNSRAFPVTESRFARDLSKLSPRSKLSRLSHGEWIEIRDGKISDLGKYPFVSAVDSSHELEWRPDAGVPALRDYNQFEYSDRQIRKKVNAFLEMLPRLLLGLDFAWRTRMRLHEVLWRLEIVFPSSEVQSYALDFSQQNYELQSHSRDADLITSICASAITALMLGDCNAYCVLFNKMRVVNKVYAVHYERSFMCWTLADEPIIRTILNDADTRYAIKLARRLSREGGLARRVSKR